MSIEDALVPCAHGQYESHNYTAWDDAVWSDSAGWTADSGSCDGGRPVTVDDFDEEAAAYKLAGRGYDRHDIVRVREILEAALGTHHKGAPG